MYYDTDKKKKKMHTLTIKIKYLLSVPVSFFFLNQSLKKKKRINRIQCDECKPHKFQVVLTVNYQVLRNNEHHID